MRNIKTSSIFGNLHFDCDLQLSCHSKHTHTHTLTQCTEDTAHKTHSHTYHFLPPNSLQNCRSFGGEWQLIYTDFCEAYESIWQRRRGGAEAAWKGPWHPAGASGRQRASRLTALLGNPPPLTSSFWLSPLLNPKLCVLALCCPQMHIRCRRCVLYTYLETISQLKNDKNN